MAIYYQQGDAIEGQRIAAQARSIGRILVAHGSSSHRIQTTVLRESAYCVIEAPLRKVTEGKGE